MKYVLGGAVSALLLSAVAASAATVTYTEGKRTETIGGVDVSGYAALSGNGDIDSFDVGTAVQGDSAMVIGRVAGVGNSDAWTSSSVTGTMSLSIDAYAESSRAGVSPFSAMFELIVDGTSVETITLSGTSADTLTATFADLKITGDSVEILITSLAGRSDYDLSASISAVPLPATAAFLLAGLAGLGVAGRRKKA